MATTENKARQLRGELYYAFTPENVKARRRCTEAVNRYNSSTDVSRRKRVELWREYERIVGDTTPLPPVADNEDEDEELFADEAWVEPPVRIDYGTNVRLGANVYINFNATILDTCLVTIGARTLLASNVSLFSATHPLDPAVRNGTNGPEMGGEIHIGEDCWIGGNVTILSGVSIGNGSVVGAGSVVTKNVPPYVIVAGNPARKLRDVPRDTHEEVTSGALAALERDQAEAAEEEDNCSLGVDGRYPNGRSEV